MSWPSNLFFLLFLLSNLFGATQTQDLCTDENPACSAWARIGECERNPAWMKFHCQVSCQTCNLNRNTSSLASVLATPKIARSNPAPEGCRSVMTVEVENRQVFSVGAMRARFQERMCADAQTSRDCSINICFHKKFRTIDGTCNNFQKTVAGGAFTSYLRLLPPAYDDGVTALVSSVTRRRPSPREVTWFLLSSEKSLPTHANSLFMQFAQFVSHDVTSKASLALCGTCNTGGPLCSAIQPTPTDRRRICTPFTRSFPVCGTGRLGVAREQLNENTAFIDGSGVYGSEGISARSLRFGAMLRSSIVGGQVFPPITNNNMLAGDSRITIFAGLAAQHTSFLRLHNNIAAQLQNMNRRWTADRIYQETRKIVGAVIQIITYEEFLPLLIGNFANIFLPAYNGYNASATPGVLNEFAGGAYRLHGMIQEQYPMINRNFQVVGKFSFIQETNSFQAVLQSIDNLYRGLMATPARSPQRLTTSVTEKLFSGTSDMSTINIQRGRDHGLRSYNDYRRLCGLPVLTSFDNWLEVSDPSVRERMSNLYKSVEDIDFYVGGVVEDSADGSIVGPTFSCIIGKQFALLRDADRFYYENNGVFTPSQLAALRQVTMAWVLCSTDDGIDRISRKAFEIDQGQKAIPCSSIPSLNLRSWME